MVPNRCHKTVNAGGESHQLSTVICMKTHASIVNARHIRYKVDI